MMVETFRIVQGQFADKSLDGIGASMFPGRWNKRHARVVYTADSIALAQLELLANLKSSVVIQNEFVLIRAVFDDSLVEQIDLNALPDNWPSLASREATRRLGNDWYRDKRSAVLRAPSAVVPIGNESNFILNPNHTDFPSIRFDDPIPLTLDSRILE